MDHVRLDRHPCVVPAGYPPDLERRLRLRDGREVLVRPVVAADARGGGGRGCHRRRCAPAAPSSQAQKGRTIMEISGIVTALIIGLVIGALGRLAVPGRQRIGLWLTLVVGVVAALLGTLIATVFGVADTAGIDWIELALQVAFAGGGVALVDDARSRRAVSR
jgi:uncharacterized membrane protein YeaQ/YmgE (transglycosylase-associated protein family)